MFKPTRTQGILSKTLVYEYLLTWLEAFILNWKAQGVSKGTLHFYEVKFKSFIRFCENEHIIYVQQISPIAIREYILWLENNGHNPGGRHAHYRAIKSFLFWYEAEVEPYEWKNPIKKVTAPLKPDQPLEPVSIEDINKLINTCSEETFSCCRDKAIILSLLDTGARAGELLNINLADINQDMGDILIRSGKGGKPRTIFIGKNTKRSINPKAGWIILCLGICHHILRWGKLEAGKS